MFSEFQWKLGFSITTPCRSQFEVAVLIKSGNYIVPGPSTPLLINKGPHLLFCYIFPLTLKNSLLLIYFFVYHIYYQGLLLVSCNFLKSSLSLLLILQLLNPVLV